MEWLWESTSESYLEQNGVGSASTSTGGQGSLSRKAFTTSSSILEACTSSGSSLRILTEGSCLPFLDLDTDRAAFRLQINGGIDGISVRSQALEGTGTFEEANLSCMDRGIPMELVSRKIQHDLSKICFVTDSACALRRMLATSCLSLC